jgi:glyoxylase-like metal-dependent hydrolase (beta-lactamase superfamily II)
VRVQFWGTRGSIAKPGPATARYGGNTSCIEVRSARETLVIVDCGTGGHSLGQKLMSGGAKGLRGHILISHTHWDHIQGIPFFAPLFVPGSEWDIYGPKGPWPILARSPGRTDARLVRILKSVGEALGCAAQEDAAYTPYMSRAHDLLPSAREPSRAAARPAPPTR